MKTNTLVIIYILLIILNTIPHTGELVNNNSDLIPGRFVKLREFTTSYRIKSIFLTTCSGKFIATYSSGIYTYIYINNKSINTVMLGDVNYYVLENYLLLISIFRKERIDYVLIDCLSENIVFNKTIEYSTPVVLMNKPISVYYNTGSSYIDIYIDSESHSSDKYTAILRHNIVENKLDIVDIVNKTIYYGNILIHIDNYTKTPLYKLTESTIYIENTNGILNIVIGNDHYVTSGYLVLENPVKVINNTIVIEAIYGNNYKLIIYRNGLFNELLISLNYNNYSLIKIHYSYNTLILIYSSNSNYIVKYIDLLNYSEKLVLNTYSESLILNTYLDFDRDNIVETITYMNNNYYILLTSSSNYIRVYWNYLYTYLNLDTLFNTLLYNNSLYTIICFYKNPGYEIHIVKYTPGLELDNTPPYIVINKPSNQGIYIKKTTLDIFVYDNESGVYLLSIVITRDNSIIYRENTTSSIYYKELYLEPGKYLLKTICWNNDGVFNEKEIVFYVLEYDIYIVKPRNYSFVSNIFELEIVSNQNFTLLVSIDNTFNLTLNTISGLNKFIVNISNLPDKLIEITIVVNETNSIYKILIYKDTSAPYLIVEGLENYTVVFYNLSFNITVVEINPNATFIILNNTILYSYNGNGSFTYTLSTIGFKPGFYILIIESIDLANNTNRLVYVIYIGEVGDPEIIIEPEPLNNTFVTGYLVFNITCINVSKLEVFINNNLYYSIDINRVKYSEVVSFNTTNWFDGLYNIVFKAIGYNLKTHILSYNWFIDNKSPLLNIVIPIIGIVWRNNSFIPVRDPFLNITYIYRFNNEFFVKIYLNISDFWLDRAELFLNNSLVEIYDPVLNTTRIGVFNESRGYFIYVKIPSEGFFVLKLTARDRVNHVSEQVIGFRVDLYPPHVVIYEPVNNTLSNKKLFNLTLIVYDSISNIVGIGLAVLTSEFRAIDLSKYVLLALISVNKTHTIELPEIRGVDGKYCLSILAIDQGFNYIVLNNYVTIDTKPPLIKYNYSIVNKTLFIEIEFFDETTCFSHAYLEIINKTKVLFNETRVFYSINLEPGNYTVVIEAWDIVGNSNKTRFNIVVLETPVKQVEEQISRDNTYVIVLTAISIAIVLTIIVLLVIKKKRAVNTSPVHSSTSPSTRARLSEPNK